MKPLFRLTTTSIISLVLTSCAVGPDFKTPDTQLPTEYSRAKLNHFSPNVEKDPQVAWWENFKDETLNRLISNASSENFSIQSAIERIEEAEANTRGSYFGLIPQFTIGAQYIKNKTAAARFPGIASRGIQFGIYSLSGQTSWEIDLFGKLRRQSEGFATIKDKSIYNLADLLRLLQAQVGTTYLELRGLQKKKQVVDQTIANQIEIFNLTKAKFDIGQASQIDFERSNVQLETTKARGYEVQGLIDASVARLSTLTRLPIVELEERLNSSIQLPIYDGPLVIGSPTELLNKRPDVRIAEEEAHLATTNIGVAWANFLPQVAFNGTLSRDALSASDWNTSAAKAYNYGPSISWSILNLGTLINELDASEASTKAAVLNYRSVVILALEEVEISLSNLTTEQKRAEHLKNALDSAKEAYRISQLQYDQGILPYADLLLIEQERLQTELDSIDSEVKLSGNYVNLFKSLGGAWEEDKAHKEPDTNENSL